MHPDGISGRDRSSSPSDRLSLHGREDKENYSRDLRGYVVIALQHHNITARTISITTPQHRNTHYTACLTLSTGPNLT
jgi:hypothetical protein